MPCGRMPTAWVCPRASSWATTLGRYPSASTAFSTATRFDRATGTVLLRTRDTVATDTPACSAMSLIVTFWPFARPRASAAIVCSRAILPRFLLRCRTTMRLSRCLLVLSLSACARESESARAALSEAVKVDQVGYLPARAKLALVTDPAATGSFAVRRSADGSQVLTGSLGPPIPDSDTGDTVRVADFTALGQTGSFYLDVAGVGASHEFDVAPDVYAKVFYLAM